MSQNSRKKTSVQTSEEGSFWRKVIIFSLRGIGSSLVSLLAFCLFLLVFVSVYHNAQASYTQAPYHSPQKRLNIIATTSQIGDILVNITQDRAEITSLLGPQIDPHLYKLTRSDTSKILNADILIYNGLYLEGRMATLFEKIKESKNPIYAISDLVNSNLLIKKEDQQAAQSHNPYDPHIWNNVKIWIDATQKLVPILCGHDKANCSFYTQNARAYTQQLMALDLYIQEALSSIPEQSRMLITAHDAFNYLGQAYHIKVVGIQGLSTESEAGLHELNKLIDMIIDKNIKAIFVETSISDKNIKALIEGSKARGHDLKIGGYLYSDAMGPKGDYEGTYVGMMDHNITTIVKALSGNEYQVSGFKNNPRYASHTQGLTQK